jgi:hypothetical protein
MKTAIEHRKWAAMVARFDISQGNVISDAQHSRFIRPRSQTECNGFHNAPGALQRFDFDGFGPNLPGFVRQAVEEHLATAYGVLYHIRHYDRRRLVSHGWFLTDYHGGELLWRSYPTSRKSESCMSYAIGKIGVDAIKDNTRRAEWAYGEMLAARAFKGDDLRDFA